MLKKPLRIKWLFCIAGGRLELTHLAALDPKSNVSFNSTPRNAQFGNLNINNSL